VKFKFEMFKPAIVLTVITVIISAVLIITANFMPDTSGVITDKLRNKCVELMGEGEFELVLDKPDLVDKMIVKDDGSVAFEITVRGYKPDGLTLLVAMNGDGSVRGVAVIAVRDDPGIGTKVEDPGFLSRFVNADSPVSIVRGTPKDDNEIEGITGATYSAKGVADAVNIAMEVYSQLGGVSD